MDTFDTSKTIEIEQSPWRMAGVAVLGVILTTLALGVALNWIGRVVPGSREEFFGYAGALFFGLCTILAAWRLFTASGAIVTITQAGIRDTRVATELIPWNAIKSIGTWTYRRQSILVFKIDPEVEKKLSLTKIARFTRSANTTVGADGLCVSAAGLKTSFDKLRECVLAYASAARTET